MTVSQRAQEPAWLHSLHILQNFLALAYAISLPVSMTASWVLLCIAMVAVTAELLLSPKSLSKLWHRAPLAVPIIALACAVAVSGAFNGGTDEGARSVLSLKALLAYFVASHCFSRYPILARNCVMSLLCTAAVGGVWGAIQQLGNIHPGYHWLQGTGFLSGPMAFAGQMQLTSMLAVGLLLSRGYRQFPKPLSNQAVFLLVVLANIAGLVFASERSAWLGGIFGVAAAASLMSWRTLIKTAVMLAVLMALGWATVPVVHTRVNSMLSGNADVSTRVRFTVWHRAVDEWQRSPMLGIGFLKFPHMDIREAIVPGVSKDINHAHSNYLQMLATTGVVGLAAFLWLLIAIFVACRRLYDFGMRAAMPLFSGYGAGLLAATVSLSVAGLFEYNFGTAQVRLAQWFLLGLLAVMPGASSDS
ncbi:MAG TPA: O-antigen ligase family protein [Candidatus Obscuribacterales bacterium]